MKKWQLKSYSKTWIIFFNHNYQHQFQYTKVLCKNCEMWLDCWSISNKISLPEQCFCVGIFRGSTEENLNYGKTIVLQYTSFKLHCFCNRWSFKYNGIVQITFKQRKGRPFWNFLLQRHLSFCPPSCLWNCKDFLAAVMIYSQQFEKT